LFCVFGFVVMIIITIVLRRKQSRLSLISCIIISIRRIIISSFNWSCISRIVFIRRFIYIIGVILIAINLIIILYNFFLLILNIPTFVSFNLYFIKRIKLATIIITGVEQRHCFMKVCNIAYNRCIQIILSPYRCACSASCAIIYFSFCVFFSLTCSTY